MNRTAKLLLPAIALGGLAYLAYKKHQERRRPSAILVSTEKHPDLGLTAYAGNHDADRAEKARDTDERLKRIRHAVDTDFGESPAKDKSSASGLSSDVSVGADVSDEVSDSDHGNLDHLFVPKSLNPRQESSVRSIASDLRSVVDESKYSQVTRAQSNAFDDSELSQSAMGNEAQAGLDDSDSSMASGNASDASNASSLSHSLWMSHSASSIAEEFNSLFSDASSASGKGDK